MMGMRKYNWEILEFLNFEIYLFDHYLAPNLLSAAAASFKFGSIVSDF